jgi:3-hydroxybutyryl-CoA dehydrogenase
MTIDGIKKVCAIGTGTMGATTALCFAMKGYDVHLLGRRDDSLKNARKNIDEALKACVTHDLISESDVPSIRARLKISRMKHDNDKWNYPNLVEAASDADLVIESIDEKLEPKHEIFSTLDWIAPSHAIFGSNSSSLMPTQIASVLSDQRKTQFAGMHFFNPPYLMSLVEVIRGNHTSDATMETTRRLMESIGKEPVTVESESPGFIVNVAQVSLLKTGFDLCDTGVTDPATFDETIKWTVGQWLGEIGPIEMELSGRDPAADASNSQRDIALSALDTLVRVGRDLIDRGITTEEGYDLAIRHTLGRRLKMTGPIESADMGGLEVFKNIFENVGLPVPRLIEEALAQGHKGVETLHGVYEWNPDMLAMTKGARVNELVRWLGIDAMSTHSASSRPEMAPPRAPTREYAPGEAAQ